MFRCTRGSGGSRSVGGKQLARSLTTLKGKQWLSIGKRELGESGDKGRTGPRRRKLTSVFYSDLGILLEKVDLNWK